MSLMTREIPREAWRPYFDELSEHLGTVEATIEVLGEDIGAQTEPGGPPEDLQRMVEHPERILVATGGPPPLEMTIDIQDAEQRQTLIHVERPPALPGE